MLASGTAASPPAQPYFIHARIAAAATATGAQRVALLRAALLTASERMCDWLRLQIFYAEAQSSNQQQANVAITPVLARNGWIKISAAAKPPAPWSADEDTLMASPNQNNGAYMAKGDDMNDDSQGNEDLSESADAASYSVRGALPDDAAKLKLMLAVAAVEEHQGNLVSAEQDYAAAAELASSSTETAAYKAHAKTLADALALAAENNARRPVVQDSIEQTVLVRPRLTSLKEVR